MSDKLPTRPSDEEPEGVKTMAAILFGSQNQMADPNTLALQKVGRIYMDFKHDMLHKGPHTIESMVALLRVAAEKVRTEVVVEKIRDYGVQKFEGMITKLETGGTFDL